MAPSALPYERSHIALKALHRTINERAAAPVDLALPERPRNLSTERDPYIDDAISMLSASTNYLYDEHAPWVINTLEVKSQAEQRFTKLESQVTKFESQVNERFTKLENQVDEVKSQVDEVKSQVNEVKSQVNEVKSQVNEVKSQVNEVKSQVNEVKSQVNEVKSQVNEVKSQVNERFTKLESQVDEVKSLALESKSQAEEIKSLALESKAVKLNSLRKWLDDPIQPILAPIQVGNLTRYTATEEFPKTIRDFWKLASNSPTLAHLARHYSISGWERWGRHGSDDTDATEYSSLEDAVTAHRDKCLQMLAFIWGLQYSELERPDYSKKQKRKAATDDGSSSRRVRAREEVESDRVESIISRGDDGAMFRQDRVTRVGPRMPFTTEITWSEVVERYPPIPGHRRMSFESAVLGWRNRSDSTDHRRFHDI